MDNLVGLGKVERFQGKGTFVTRLNHNEDLKVTDIPLRNKLVRSIDVVSVQKENRTEIQNKLKIKSDYFKIIRVYYVGHDTVSDVNFSYVPIKYINEKHLKNLSEFDSVYKLYKDDFGINAYILPFKQKNSIIKLPKGLPIDSFDSAGQLTYCFYQDRTTYLSDGRILEYINDYKNPEFFYQLLQRG